MKESMSKKMCELCNNRATMFCQSDEANLCWACDERVHSVNFLVANHCRTLLCHSPTPWKAAGRKLQPTVSTCHACADVVENQLGGTDGDLQKCESDEGENQVVPWSKCISIDSWPGPLSFTGICKVPADTSPR